MKFILLVILMCMSLSANAYSTEFICIQGYVFAVTVSTNGVSMVQVYRPGAFNNSPPQPLTCSG
jgi:hypothetical protein